ncbi:hypothetical protein [Chromobacterium amazonense]|uniref:HBL/NHE enterotoxin family protein n=1 Tax=Chromobacterium amazonense TaxID=1382803 RepID=A0ABU8V2F5_9NEIS|nr:hypothetical protein [Chromobacterium amazonense]MBM2886718.1 hypothetical protein [Chromobacterium amazonense]MDE1713270.1 hypothetical protein [Chromobacterium amazonense]MDQ4538883.1 hypothetical protein [Chromobacterium amazonense]
MLKTITQGDASQSIDLGDQDMLVAVLSSSNNALLTESYGNLLRQQQALAGTGIDSGLAIKIAAYQGQMNHQAQYFQQKNLSGLINLITYASNFAALVSAFNNGLSADDQQLYALRQTYAQQLNGLADLAEDYQVGAKATNTQYQVTVDSLNQLMASYDQSMVQLINSLSDEAKQLNKDIDALIQAIAANIQAIVDQGEKAGAGVRELGLAILSSLTLKEEKDKDGKPAASKPGDQVEYMVSGITALTGGIAGSSQAAKDLRSNNDKLATAYQALAQANAMITVAKSVQAQTQLFVEAYRNTQQKIVLLPQSWGQIASAFRKSAFVWQNLTPDDDLARIRRNVSLCNTEWQLLAGQVADIKESYAGNGSLPLA